VPCAREQPFVRELLRTADPGRPALLESERQLTYAQLAAAVEERATTLGLDVDVHVDIDAGLDRRQVVLLTGTNSIEYVISYLALMSAGHVPLLAGSHVEKMTAAWRPAATVRAEASGVAVDLAVDLGVAQSRPLHPELALLLSTSGSTGSPKLVRLSDRNVSSNAHAIRSYLELTPDDRGISSLPLHYCYGLSVLHSHLAAGASVVLTDASVVDPCFTDALQAHGVTNVAGVPHTFELLERSGRDRLNVPTLRFITQAGGRMAPERVEQWVRRAERWGAKFYVMYGQTEATARMAYLPPEIARRRPSAIGRPIPGGCLELRPVDGLPDDVGELVYRGPNVMLGYATTDADLALGATLTELPTGDIGRFHADDGVFEIVGRRSRFAKPFGVRVDLDVLERELGRTYAEVAVGGDDERLVVVAPGASAAVVSRRVSESIGLPGSLIAVDTTGPVPRTERGKIDYEAVRRRGEALCTWPDPVTRSEGSVATVFAAVLGRPDVEPTSTFVSLGGDSLSYIECSLRLEQLRGSLPSDWHLRSVAELEVSDGATSFRGADRDRHDGASRRFGGRIDTTLALRSGAICAVVATHMHVLFFPGGAHLMLAVAGYNLSRFLLPIAGTAERVRAGVRTALRTAAPAVLWTAGGILVAGWYSAGTLLLVNNYLGPASHRNARWHFWFIEVFVHVTVLVTLLIAIPAVRRLERRIPYWFALAILVALLVLRLEWAWLDDWYNLRYRTHGIAWFFALGWLIHQSDRWWQRALTSVLCLWTISGFFNYPQRDWFIAIALLVLVWVRDVPFPRLAIRPIAVLATATLWIFITHFSVFPPLVRALGRGWAYVATILVGIAAWAAYERLSRAARWAVVTRRSRRTAIRPEPALAAAAYD